MKDALPLYQLYFSVITRTGDCYFCKVIVQRATQPAGGVDGGCTRLGASICPLNALVAPPPRNESVGGLALKTFYGEVWPLD